MLSTLEISICFSFLARFLAFTDQIFENDKSSRMNEKSQKSQQFSSSAAAIDNLLNSIMTLSKVEATIMGIQSQ
jgi:hypothetical protein